MSIQMYINSNSKMKTCIPTLILQQMLPLLVVFCIRWVPPVYSFDECLSCASNVEECRTGNVAEVQKCDPGNVCIAVNIQNVGDIPYYIRGCGSNDTCSVMQSVHGDAHRFCETCEGDRCNNKVIGGANLSGLKCKFCAENSEECRAGKTEKDIQCIDGDDHCYTEYIQNVGHQPYYRRGCGVSDRCQQQARSHSDALLYCDTCKDNECNNKTIGPENIENLECFSCKEGSDSCRTGEVTTVERCNITQGYLSCVAYFDFAIGIHTRGCSIVNQCGRNPICKICNGSKCNNETIGPKYEGVRTCYSCNKWRQ